MAYHTRHIIANESEIDVWGNNDRGTYHPELIVTINCVLNAPLMLVCLIGSASVLAAIVGTPSLRSPSMVFLCSLAPSDFLIRLIAQPVYIADELNPGSPSLSHTRRTSTLLACGVSLCTMSVISASSSSL